MRISQEGSRYSGDEHIDAGYLVIGVDGSNCEVEPGSKSRYNEAHCKVIIAIILENYRWRGYSGTDICVMTPYTAQAVRGNAFVPDPAVSGRMLSIASVIIDCLTVPCYRLW
jgi:hypothetical protein